MDINTEWQCVYGNLEICWGVCCSSYLQEGKILCRGHRSLSVKSQSKHIHCLSPTNVILANAPDKRLVPYYAIILHLLLMDMAH